MQQQILLPPAELLLAVKSKSVNVQNETNLKDLLLKSYRELPVKRVEDIVTMPNKITLGAVKREVGCMQMRAMLTLIIGDMLDFLSIGKTMGAGQIAQTVMMIEQEYFYLTVEDFKVCFDAAKRGDYGQLYDRIDGQIILTWLSIYVGERSQAFGNHNDAVAMANKERDDRGGADMVRLTLKRAGLIKI